MLRVASRHGAIPQCRQSRYRASPMDGRGAFVGRKATLLSQLLLDPEPTLKVLCDRLDEIASSCCRRRPLANTPMPKRTANMVIAVTRMGSGGRLSSQPRIFVSTSRIIAATTLVSRTNHPSNEQPRRPLLPLAHMDEPILAADGSEFRWGGYDERCNSPARFGICMADTVISQTSHRSGRGSRSPTGWSRLPCRPPP